MITRFKLFEDYSGIPWVNPEIKNILDKHKMWLDMSNFGRYGSATLLHRVHHMNDSCREIISDINLTSLFEALQKLIKHKNNYAYNKLTIEKVSEIIDEICEYQIMRVNPEHFEILKDWMSPQLIEKLENDSEVGPRISANKYNL